MFYKIDAGHAALSNGAVAPLNKLFALAGALQQEVITGHSYGDDYLRVPEGIGDREAAESLLDDACLVWNIVDHLPAHLSYLENTTGMLL